MMRWAPPSGSRRGGVVRVWGDDFRYDGGGWLGRVVRRLVGLIVCVCVALPPAHAQTTVTLMPSVIRTHIFGGPLVQSSGGSAHHLPSTSDLELILAVATPTKLPRLSVFGSVQWLPNAGAQRNPYTLYTADELGGRVRANAPTATFGLSYGIVAPAQTSGWLDVAGNVGDLYSQAARPDDRSAYTHKLDLDLLTHIHAFARTPEHAYLHDVSLFALLDYVATGLPRAGDQVPTTRRFLSAARPAALIVGLAIPLVRPTS
jgi:hypothetical protein